MRVLKVCHRKVNVHAVGFSPDGSRLIVRADDAPLRPRNVPIHDQTGLGRVEFHAAPDGGQVMSVYAAAEQLYLWDVHTGEQTADQTGLVWNARVAFHPSGRWLFGSDRYNPLAAYDLTTQTTSVWDGETMDGFYCRPCFSPDGRMLLYPFDRKTGEKWQACLTCRRWADGGAAPTVGETHLSPAHPEDRRFITGLAVLPDGERFATTDFGHPSGACVTLRVPASPSALSPPARFWRRTTSTGRSAARTTASPLRRRQTARNWSSWRGRTCTCGTGAI